MERSRYTISQAAEILGVRDSVLRYWEDELDLRVHRNGQGHRYYTGYDIQLFLNIKELKKKGLQLRAIREVIPKIALKAPGSSDSKIKLLTMDGMEAPKAEPALTHEDKLVIFQTIMEKLLEQEITRKSEGESRYRSLDQAIRRHQTARREAAAAMESGRLRKRKSG